jgi:Rrf2 family iron-sulfur cluster assembly transcriptional regulator
MFCLYSKGCEYAIRAMAEISGEKSAENFRAKDICRRAGIPEPYARKTFQALVQNGFLKAVPGPGGGYSLVRDPHESTVMDVVEAVDGKANYTGCVMGLSACNDKAPCSLHFEWLKIKGLMVDALRSRSLSDLSKLNRLSKQHSIGAKNQRRPKTTKNQKRNRV